MNDPDSRDSVFGSLGGDESGEVHEDGGGSRDPSPSQQSRLHVITRLHHSPILGYAAGQSLLYAVEVGVHNAPPGLRLGDG